MCLYVNLGWLVILQFFGGFQFSQMEVKLYSQLIPFFLDKDFPFNEKHSHICMTICLVFELKVKYYFYLCICPILRKCHFIPSNSCIKIYYKMLGLFPHLQLYSKSQEIQSNSRGNINQVISICVTNQNLAKKLALFHFANK